jgi:hypothetical protein
MPTITPHVEHETRLAWSEYAERLHGLEGEEYDVAEQAAWDHLQSTLAALGAHAATIDDPSVG